MWTPNDETFLDVAQELGFLTAEQAQECQEACETISATGAKITLTKLVQDKGYLAGEALSKIAAELRKRGVHPRIGHYDVLTRLGAGGSATVYKAVDTRDRRVVALKVLAPALAADSKSVRRFVRGAELAAKVKHPNIAETYEVSREGQQYYIAMEFVQGISLIDMAKEGQPLPELEALQIIKQIAEGLAVCHEQGIVHRDVKPSNIMVTLSGMAKLLDLGLAREAESASTDVTMTGHVVGTPHYMSPEQCAAAKDVDARADIYSLGATLFYALTGRPPFSGETTYEIMKQQASSQLPNPMQFNPNVSEATHALIWRMMAKDRKMRHQTAREVVEAIRQVELAQPPGDTYDIAGAEIGAGDMAAEMRKFMAEVEAAEPAGKGKLSRTILRRVKLIDERLAKMHAFILLWEDYGGYIQRAKQNARFMRADEANFADLQDEIAKRHAQVLPLLAQSQRGGKVIRNCRERLPLAAVAASAATVESLDESLKAGAKLLSDFRDFLQYARRRVISQNFVRYTVARYGGTPWGKAVAAVLIMGVLFGLGVLMVAAPVRWFGQKHETPAVARKPSEPSPAATPGIPAVAVTTTLPTSAPAIAVTIGPVAGLLTISVPAVPRRVALGNGWTADEVVEMKGTTVVPPNILQLPVVNHQGNTIAFALASVVSHTDAVL